MSCLGTPLYPAQRVRRSPFIQRVLLCLGRRRRQLCQEAVLCAWISRNGLARSRVQSWCHVVVHSEPVSAKGGEPCLTEAAHRAQLLTLGTAHSSSLSEVVLVRLEASPS